MKLDKSLIYPRLVMLSVWCFGFLATGAAQTFSGAVVAGLNACQIDGDDLAGFDKVGLTAGFVTTVKFKSAFTLNMDFLYSERGSRPDIFSPEYDPNIEISLKYIEIPVYIAIGDWWQEEGQYYKVSAYGGFSYGRLMDAQAVDYYNPVEVNYDELVQYFNENDVSWLLGVDYRMSPRWGMTFRYTRGITPLLNPEKYDLNTERLLSYFLTFRVGYYFK